MKVTADTITDEQIRELRETQSPVTGNVRWACSIALGEQPSWCTCDEYRAEARARCAEAWNARHGGDEPTQHGPCDDCDNFADLDENSLCAPCAERSEKIRGGAP